MQLYGTYNTQYKVWIWQVQGQVFIKKEINTYKEHPVKHLILKKEQQE